MLTRWIMLCLLLMAGAARAQESETMQDKRWSIAVHGGAGTMAPDRMTEAQQADYRAALAAALDAGAAVLSAGGTALDWSIVAYLGVFQVGLAYLLLTRGIRGVPALEASMLLLVEPALNPIIAWLVHDEAPGVLPTLGGALILAATVLRAWAAAATDARRRAPSSRESA